MLSSLLANIALPVLDLYLRRVALPYLCRGPECAWVTGAPGPPEPRQAGSSEGGHVTTIDDLRAATLLPPDISYHSQLKAPDNAHLWITSRTTVACPRLPYRRTLDAGFAGVAGDLGVSSVKDPANECVTAAVSGRTAVFRAEVTGVPPGASTGFQWDVDGAGRLPRALTEAAPTVFCTCRCPWPPPSLSSASGMGPG